MLSEVYLGGWLYINLYSDIFISLYVWPSKMQPDNLCIRHKITRVKITIGFYTILYSRQLIVEWHYHTCNVKLKMDTSTPHTGNIQYSFLQLTCMEQVAIQMYMVCLMPEDANGTFYDKCFFNY